VIGEGRRAQQVDGSGPDGGDKQAHPVRATGGGGENRPPEMPTGRSGWKRKRAIGIGLVTAAVVAAGTTYAVTQSGGGNVPAPRPMHVTSVTPATSSTGVDGASPITISFSGRVAAKTPRPRLEPSVPGRWTSHGRSMVFMPSVAFGPHTQVTISIPGGRHGMRAVNGAQLTASVTTQFRTRGYSQLALAELLAEQGYLPMTFTPASTGLRKAQSPKPAPALDPATLTPAGEAYNPPAGNFAFAQGYPSSLQSQWNPDSPNVLLRGAVMAFQSEHNMTINGTLTRKFWTALLLAQEHGQRNQNGYTYAVADQHDPEYLTIYHNGHVVLRSLTNTGIPVSPTVNGTFPVYQKYRFQIMSGTNPGGSTYADPVSFVSYFNGGDAVHYFPRGGYGYQQSLGCVELPYNAAEQAYPYLTYGSLVTVTG
jgi:hypothetical protein